MLVVDSVARMAAEWAGQWGEILVARSAVELGMESAGRLVASTAAWKVDAMAAESVGRKVVNGVGKTVV